MINFVETNNNKFQYWHYLVKFGARIAFMIKVNNL